MDESTNGHKRPFGPHGEGCTCDPEEVDAVETPEIPVAGLGQDTQEVTVHDIIWASVSETLATQVVTAINQCGLEKIPMTERQITHVLAGVMRGYAISKQRAEDIELSIARMLSEARAQEKPKTEDDKLNSVHDLFKHRHQRPRGDEPA